MARVTAKAAAKHLNDPHSISRVNPQTSTKASTKQAVCKVSDSEEEIVVHRAAVRRNTMATTNNPQKKKGAMLDTPEDSDSRSNGSTGGDLSEYDTPGTTPALSTSAGSSLKRKRGIHSKVEDDAALALKLQEEEYVKDTALNKRVKQEGFSIMDTESEQSELSDAPTLKTTSSDDVPLKLKRKRGNSTRSGKLTLHVPLKRVLKDEESALDDYNDDDDDEVSDFEADQDSALETEAEDDSDVADITTTATIRSIGRRHGNITAAGGQQLAVRIRGRVRRRHEDRKYRERKKLEAAHPEIKTMWDDLKKLPIITPTPAAQPEAISRTLKSFQLEGLDWLVKQEQSCYKGGLLGDEMGMGKTIQAVSLIMSDYPTGRPSLVVVPPVALMQWQSEISEYTNGKLNVLVYHGQNNKVKQLSKKDLEKYDVIMVSYNGLESLHRKQEKGWVRNGQKIQEGSPLHDIKFHRLILDEAHQIKTRTTGMAKACFALQGTYKWCLSGTPVQNRIGEFFSLLRFLEVRPFADYFCKKCKCAELHWQVDEKQRCKSCGHTSLEHVSVFNQELLNPLTQAEDPADREAAMAKLHMITARIMLRRVKKDHTSSMELPPKEVIVSSNFFGDVEKDFSTSIMSNSERKFNTYVHQDVVLNNYANIFGLIMQMRQVANHPDLLLRKNAAEGQNVLACHICDEVAEDAVRSQCKHEFCRACVKSYMSTSEAAGAVPDCPRCHIPLAIDLEQPEIEQDEENVKKSSIINRIKMEDWTSSTKIEMLVYELYKLRSKKQTTKSIVFSNFTSMLQLVEWRLRRAGFNTVMLDGSMTPIQRQRSIEYFMTNPTVEVFLVSLKAGGVALNLTEASRVFIVDPWWNPAAEWQSADRCHRIGQRRPCVITRLCIEDSVESRMVMLQEKKANMINSTINNDKASFAKLTPEDMQFLFRGS